MITYKVGLSVEECDKFIEESPYGNLLQGSKWTKVKDNWQSRRIGFYQGDQLVACASLLCKKIINPYKVAYIPRGPVMDYNNQELVYEVFQALKIFGKKEGFLLIKCDPAVLFDRSNQLQVEECQKLITTIEKTGAIWSGLTLKLSETIQPRFQANKYLTAESIEDYQKHVRRLVKTAHKKGVEISKGHENELEVFSDLVALTEKRKQIHLRNYDYFKKIKDIYKEQAQFYFATLDLEKQIRTQKERLEQLENDLLKTPEHQKSRIRDIEQQKAAAKKQIMELQELVKDYPNQVIIAGVLGIQFGSGVELLYAGMDDNFRQYYPQYLLDTEIFKSSYELGFKWANMGGVEGNLDGGLATFKTSFKPTIDEYIGEFNIPLNKTAYKLGRLTYKKYKRVKKQLTKGRIIK